MDKTLQSVNDDYNGFQQLIRLFGAFNDCLFENINIHLRQFFSANMSAPLGAILDLLSKQNNITLQAEGPIQTILQKNNFLSYYGYPSAWDSNKTTIQYIRFKRNESEAFAQYLNTKLLNRPELPRFTPKAQMAIAQVILEIFTNAGLHTKTDYIYTCGQFFPNKHCIDFSIVDTGAGIKNTVNSGTGKTLNAIDAIKWALVDGNTTKRGVPGGYGLTILQNFLHLNGGCLQIISNDGYYKDSNGRQNTFFFRGEFPGTVLNLQIKTDDDNLYCLKNE